MVETGQLYSTRPTKSRQIKHSDNGYRFFRFKQIYTLFSADFEIAVKPLSLPIVVAKYVAVRETCQARVVTFVHSKTGNPVSGPNTEADPKRAQRRARPERSADFSPQQRGTCRNARE